MSKRSAASLERGRRYLWANREIYIPHMLEHRCVVGEGLAATCAAVRWTYESYLLAVIFDRYDLIVEVAE